MRSAAPLDFGRHAVIIVFGFAIASACFSVAARAPVNAGDPDPADRKALVAVCGKCHKVGLFDKSIRSEPDWRDTLQAMVDRGAEGTDEQFARIFNYLQRTLTIVNVNSASAPQLAPVLGVSEQTAQAIVAQRGRQGKFSNLGELERIPGVDAAGIEARKARIAF